MYGKVFENALLGLFDAVVVGVKDFPRLGKVDVHLGKSVPGQIQDPLDIGAQDGVIRGNAAHAAQLVDLGKAAFPGCLWQILFLQALFEVVQILHDVHIAAKLLVDGLDLFGQVVLALGLVHLLAHAHLDALFQDGHGVGVGNMEIDLLQALAHIEEFQDLLLLLIGDGQSGDQGVRKGCGILLLQYGTQGLWAGFSELLAVAHKLFYGLADEVRDGLDVGHVVDLVLKALYEACGITLGKAQVADACTIQPLEEALDGAVWHAEELHDVAGYANGVHVFAIAHFFEAGIFLQGQENRALGLVGLLHSEHALFPSYIKGNDGEGEDDNIDNRQNRHFLRGWLGILSDCGFDHWVPRNRGLGLAKLPATVRERIGLLLTIPVPDSNRLSQWV